MHEADQHRGSPAPEKLSTERAELKRELVPEFSELSVMSKAIAEEFHQSPEEEEIRLKRERAAQDLDVLIRSSLADERTIDCGQIELGLELLDQTARTLSSHAEQLPTSSSLRNFSEVLFLSKQNNFNRASKYFEGKTADDRALPPAEAAFRAQDAIYEVVDARIIPMRGKFDREDREVKDAIRAITLKVDQLREPDTDLLSSIYRSVQDLLIAIEQSDKARFSIEQSATDLSSQAEQLKSAADALDAALS